MRRIFLKLFRRRRMEQDIEAELAFHREMATSQGNAIPLGNTAVIQEQARDLWRFNVLENIGRDLAYAARGLWKSPGFVLAALLSLGLGIGVNTAMFTLANEFLLSEPSVRDSSSIVGIRVQGGSHAKVRTIDFLRDSGVFEDVTGENAETFVNWDNGQETQRTFCVQAAKNYFTMLGIPVARGRGWRKDDSDQVAVLSHRFWLKHFDGDPAVVGRGMRLDGRMYTIIGVLPESHRTLIGYGYSPDLYVPRFLEDVSLAIYARLKPGMGVGEAAAATRTVAENMDRAIPDRQKYAEGIKVTPVGAVGRLQSEKTAMTLGVFFAVLLLMVGLVLLIACVNVASLLLARASSRRHEIAIRLSLGAGRGRLLQQFMAESLLLSILGAALGFALALFVARALAAIPLPLPVPIRLHIEPDWRVATYAAILAVAATILTGLLPAWQSLKDSFNADLQRNRKLRLRRGLVAFQVGVSLVVLLTGSLFLRSLVRSSAISPGFDVQRTLRAEVHLPPAPYKGKEPVNAFIERSLEELAAVPGVEKAAAARIIPFTDSTTFGTELTFSDNGEKTSARFNWNAVSADFFAAMDIPILGGRAFTREDRGEAKVVIVNNTFVERYLNGRNPIGLTFNWGEGKTLYQIVGVAAGTKNMTIGEDPKAQLYQPLAQIDNDRPRIQFVLRSAVPPATQLAPVRQVLRRIEPGAGIEVATLYSSIGLAFLPSQIGAALMGGIGAVGLLLAAVGLYGVMAFSVARRTREIGIRVAIGASRSSIARMVLSESTKLILAGAIPGLFVAFFITKPLARFLVPGLSTSDPVSFVGVFVVLAATGLIAALGPLRRAVTVDPARCLRWE